jgi:hypothetical protein
MENPRRTVIGLAIIALVALAIVALPGGGAATQLVNNALQAGFLVMIAYGLVRLYRTQGEWLSRLTDRDRGIVYGAVAVGLLAIVAAGRFRQLWDGGIVLVVVILAACGAAIHQVWRRSRNWAI